MHKITQPLSVPLLSTFVAIADLGSFAKAAKHIGRTEAAVSMQMVRLEQIVGEPALFARAGRQMKLTRRGLILLDHARRILRLHHETLESLSGDAALEVIRLGAPEDYSPLLPPILQKFLSQNRHAEIQLICEPSNSLTKMIGDSQIDLAVITRQENCKAGEDLRCEPLVWVCAGEPQDLRRESLRLAVFQPGCTARKIALEALTRAGLNYEIVCSSPSVSGIVQAVRSGKVIAALARCSVPDDLRILDGASGLPRLPTLELALLRTSEPTAPTYVDALAGLIKTILVAD